jgi:alpha-L-fucosidase
MTLDEKLIKTVPTKVQVEHQKTEFYAFVHFTVNTFTDKDWGDGTESPAIFNPSNLDAEQWAKTFKAAGMKGMVLTCKHHDGFCLWPSRFTEHSIKNSPYKNGKGDIVREASDACRKYGLKFGVYLSPWDRNSVYYGRGKEYDDYYVAQLTELLTQYGELFTVWFDGACGEGPNGKKQVYDWTRYYSTIRKLQPDAAITGCGPDVRWCGNEGGHTRYAEWSVVSERMLYGLYPNGEKLIKEASEAGMKEIKIDAPDLGSRELMKDEKSYIWYASEYDVSIRPGWFWHENENEKLRSLDNLIKIYDNSVGGNATLILNAPPTPEGLIHENDVQRLTELGQYIEKSFRENMTDSAEVTASEADEIHSIKNVLKDGYDAFYMPEKGNKTPDIIFKWNEPVNIGKIVLKENILCSQRVETFSVDIMKNGRFEEYFKGSVIGYQRFISMNGIKTDLLRIRITDSREEPTLAFIGIYKNIE